MNKQLLAIGLFLLAGECIAQTSISQNEAIDIALKNNLMVKSGEYQIAAQRQLKTSAIDLGKTNVTWMNGQFNSILKDNNITITQSIPFPTALSSQSKLAQVHVDAAEQDLVVTKNELIRQVRSVYQHLVYLTALRGQLIEQDSIFKRFAKATAIRHQVGEGTLLEKTSAATQSIEIANQLTQNESDIKIYSRLLQTLLNATEQLVASEALQKIEPLSKEFSSTSNPQLVRLYQDVTLASQARKVERNRLLPDFTVGYFTQSLIGFQRIDNNDVFFGKNKQFTGFELGISVPLWFVPQQSRIRAATSSMEASRSKYNFFSAQVEGELEKAQLEFAKSQTTLSFYENTANTNADLILAQAQKSFEAGEISYLEFLQAMNQVRSIRFKYLETLNQYNQSAIQLDYLTGTLIPK